MYERAVAEASRLLSQAQVSLLKLAVSLHIYSPRVEMYHQMALERGVKCPAAVDIAGSIVCSPDQLQSAVKNALVSEMICWQQLRLLVYLYSSSAGFFLPNSCTVLI